MQSSRWNNIPFASQSEYSTTAAPPTEIAYCSQLSEHPMAVNGLSFSGKVRSTLVDVEILTFPLLHQALGPTSPAPVPMVLPVSFGPSPKGPSLRGAAGGRALLLVGQKGYKVLLWWMVCGEGKMARLSGCFGRWLDYQGASVVKGRWLDYQGASVLNGRWLDYQGASVLKGRWLDYQGASVLKGRWLDYQGASVGLPKRYRLSLWLRYHC